MRSTPTTAACAPMRAAAVRHECQKCPPWRPDRVACRSRISRRRAHRHAFSVGRSPELLRSVNADGSLFLIPPDEAKNNSGNVSRRLGKRIRTGLSSIKDSDKKRTWSDMKGVADVRSP